MSKIIALGVNGIIKSIGNAKDVNINPAKLIELVYPIVEFPPLEVSGSDYSFDNIRGYISRQYQKWGLFGPFGDIIQVERIFTQSKTIFTISFIGRLAFHKPGLAADLIPFIKDKDGKIFFVGIIRKYNPGQGKFALLGGLTDIRGYNLDTAAQCLIHEGMEEAGLSIQPLDESILAKPFAKEVPVRVILGKDDNCIVDTQMILVGTFSTSRHEEMPKLGLKRVYQTTGYTLLVNVNISLNEETLQNWLSAGDDAARLVVIEISKDKMPEFGIGHHQVVFDEALKIIANRR